MVLSSALCWGLKGARRSAQHLPYIKQKQEQQDQRFAGHSEMRVSIRSTLGTYFHDWLYFYGFRWSVHLEADNFLLQTQAVDVPPCRFKLFQDTSQISNSSCLLLACSAPVAVGLSCSAQIFEALVVVVSPRHYLPADSLLLQYIFQFTKAYLKEF